MSDLEYRISADGKRIEILTYFPASYDHDEGKYPVAYIKLSGANSSYMDDFNGDYGELLALIKHDIAKQCMLAKVEGIKQGKNSASHDNGKHLIDIWESGCDLPKLAVFTNVVIVGLDFNGYGDKIVRYQVDKGCPRKSRFRVDTKGNEYFLIDSRRYMLKIFSFFPEALLDSEAKRAKKWEPKEYLVYPSKY